MYVIEYIETLKGAYIMIPEQKRAWFIIIVFAVALSCFLILLPLTNIPIAFSAFGLFGFVGLSNFLFREKREPGEVEYDERDKTIQMKSARAGAMVSYLAMGLACMGIWAFYQHQGKETISIHILPPIFMIGGMFLFVAGAITTVILYGRKITDEK
jgi:hypothetical protein